MCELVVAIGTSAVENNSPFSFKISRNSESMRENAAWNMLFDSTNAQFASTIVDAMI